MQIVVHKKCPDQNATILLAMTSDNKLTLKIKLFWLSLNRFYSIIG